jgi:V-type H+-transporting ATPase subunit E
MIKLLEEQVELKVREDEQDLVSGLLEECQDRYTEVMKQETGRDYSTELSLMDDHFLKEEEGGGCGGVILYALNRRIVVPNTLEDRLNLCFEQDLPQIRKGLFPRKDE